MKERKTFLKTSFFVFYFFLNTSLLFAQTEQITFTSYYPSPFGAYDRVRFVPRGPLPDGDCTAANLGVVYYNKVINNLKICADPGGATPWQSIGGASGGVWVQDATNIIHPTDEATPSLAVLVTDNSTSWPNGPYDGRALIEAQSTSAGNYVSLTRDGAIEVSRNNPGTGGYIDLKTTPGADLDARLYVGQGNKSFGIDMPGPTFNAFTINANGNIGIGSMLPNSKLLVNGLTQIADDFSVADTKDYASFGVTRSNFAANLSYIGMTRQGLWPWGLGIDQNSSLIMGTAVAGRTIPSPLFTLSGLNNGKLGLGTTSPLAKLHIKDTGTFPNGPNLLIEGVNSTSASPRIGLVDTWSTGNVNTAPAWFVDNKTDQFRIFRQDDLSTGGVERLVIDNAGNFTITGSVIVSGTISANGFNQSSCYWIDSAVVGGAAFCNPGDYVAGLRNNPSSNSQVDNLYCCKPR